MWLNRVSKLGELKNQASSRPQHPGDFYKESGLVSNVLNEGNREDHIEAPSRERQTLRTRLNPWDTRFGEMPESFAIQVHTK